MKAYKAFNNDWTCENFKYDIGKEYLHDSGFEICKSGFHACENISDCFNYYSFDPNTTKIAEVEMIGDIQRHSDDSKIATNHIRIIKEIIWEEVLRLCNSGDWNSGDWNSGNWNSGDWNSGNWNSGNRNSGNWNSGDWNSGNRNSGDWNSGDRNSGNWNSGDWNSGDWNSGYLNTNNPDKIRIFNKWITKEKFDKIEFPNFFYFNLTTFISYDTVTDEEKNTHKKDIETCGGFLKTLSYKDAFKLSYNKANKEDKDKVKKIPGFDKDLFFEITGIEINE